MNSKTYLWLEDRNGKSGYIFWKTFMEQLCPEIVVESKKNVTFHTHANHLLIDVGEKA